MKVCHCKEVNFGSILEVLVGRGGKKKKNPQQKNSKVRKKEKGNALQFTSNTMDVLFLLPPRNL